MLKTIGLLVISNAFMTLAWYGHLKNFRDRPIVFVILISWLIALAEYTFQVPANRIGFRYFSLPQLKVMQEVITMVVFALFAIFYMNVPLQKNFIYASLCLIGAVYFMFRGI